MVEAEAPSLMTSSATDSVRGHGHFFLGHGHQRNEGKVWLVVARWSWGLIRGSGSVLLDAGAEGAHVRQETRQAFERADAQTTDLHVWQVGPGCFAAIIAVLTPRPLAPAQYKAQLADIHELVHVTVEVERGNR